MSKTFIWLEHLDHIFINKFTDFIEEMGTYMVYFRIG